MSKYITYKIKLLTTGTVVDITAKDSIDARELAADMFDVQFDQTKLV